LSKTGATPALPIPHHFHTIGVLETHLLAGIIRFQTAIPILNDHFDDFVADSGFPTYPLQQPSSLYIQPQESYEESLHEGMAQPFGVTPTALQISAASSSYLAPLSSNAPSTMEQFFSLMQFSLQNLNATDTEKTQFNQALDSLESTFWDTYLFGNGATSSAWIHPNPSSPGQTFDAKEDTFMFGDGGATGMY